MNLLLMRLMSIMRKEFPLKLAKPIIFMFSEWEKFVTPSTGDTMRPYLKIENGVIVDAKFKTFGCGAAIAASSMTTELIKGEAIEETVNLPNEVVEALGGLPPAKMHCSVLAEDALKAAI